MRRRRASRASIESPPAADRGMRDGRRKHSCTTTPVTSRMTRASAATWFFAGTQLLLIPGTFPVANMVRDAPVDWMWAVLLLWCAVGGAVGATMFALAATDSSQANVNLPQRRAKCLFRGLLCAVLASGVTIALLFVGPAVNPPVAGVWMLTSTVIGLLQGKAWLRQRITDTRYRPG